jgi:hypothetical protein
LEEFAACVNFPVAILTVSIQRGLTAETLSAQSKEFLIKKYSDLCELCASAVKGFRKVLQQGTRG